MGTSEPNRVSAFAGPNEAAQAVNLGVEMHAGPGPALDGLGTASLNWESAWIDLGGEG
jgi:hypothetical protein